MKATLQDKLRTVGVTREEVRDHLRANMFDGTEDGDVKMRVKVLLDSVCDIIAGDE